MKKLTLLLLLTGFSIQAQIPVILNETFDRNIFGWYESNEENHKILVKDGKYYLQAPEGGWMTYVAPYVDPSKDFFFQATFTQLNGFDDNGIGFIWGYDGKQDMNNFTFTTNGYYRIWCADRSINISDEWRETELVRPLGSENVLRVEQKQRTMYYYLNGQLVTTTVSLPWYGKNMGFVAYTKMEVTIDNFIFGHDIKLNLFQGESRAERQFKIR
jgi:hypothetical protein